MEIKNSLCGFTQNNIIQISGNWISSECSLEISETTKIILSKLVDIRLEQIEEYSNILLMS